MIKEILLLFYVIVFMLYIVTKSIVFYKKYKINPFSFMVDKWRDRIYWWSIFFILIIYGVLLVLNYFRMFGSITNNIILDILGFIMLLTGFLILIVAHAQMGKSWRMGIDRKIKTRLVQTGVFEHSRNPVYLGLIIQSFGLFLLIPNLTTLVLLILLIFSLNKIIKAEEKFLEKQFGGIYLDYKKKVRRFV